MSTSFSPFHVQLLLHSYCSPATYEPWSDVAAECLKELQDLGAIVPHEEQLTRFKTTPLGNAWVRMILNTPPPRMAFLDAQGKEIE